MTQKKASPRGIRVLNRLDVKFDRPHPEVGTARVPIASAGWVETSEGAVLIDTLERPKQSREIADRIHKNAQKIKYVIYTHGHGDHTGGIRGVLDDGPEVIAQKLLLERAEKYWLLKYHVRRVTMAQFNFPPYEPKKLDLHITRTYDETMSFSLGGRTFELYHARGETDDGTWVWVPEIKTAFVGDLLIGSLPNIGNPYKPTRFALPWARALEAVRDKGPELIVTGGMTPFYAGEEAREVLDVTIEAIHSLHDQVVAAINEGVALDEMIHQVKLPSHLEKHRYLRQLYSRTEFAVYNIYRWYHGYFDFNPAHLLPRPRRELNAEILDLIGSDEKIMARASELYKAGQAQLGLEVLDLLLTRNPEDRKARRLRLDMLQTLAEEDTCLMSKNTWVRFIEKDEEFLGDS